MGVYLFGDMSTIKPHKEGCCHICRQSGDRSNKPLIGNLCYTSAPFHYQKHQEKKGLSQIQRYQQKQKEKERKPIAKHSPKRAKEEREYSKEAKAFKLANPDCAARLKGCTGATEDVHHMKGKIGDLLLDQHYWLPACRHCHDWIEKNSKKAKILGLSVSRLENVA